MAQTQEVKGVATSIRTENGYTAVRYHNTDVVQFNNEKIILNTGGHKTRTTKLRMNQTSNQYDLGYRVYAKNHEWYVDFKDETLEFENNMVLNRK